MYHLLKGVYTFDCALHAIASDGTFDIDPFVVPTKLRQCVAKYNRVDLWRDEMHLALRGGLCRALYTPQL